MIKYLHLLTRNFSKKDKRLIAAVKHIAGYKPFRLDLFQLVTQHNAIAKVRHEGFKESNERLEYLGDAILGAVVADFLFKKYPFKDEGFLTEIRSRIVNRESLNLLAKKVGLDKLVDPNFKKTNFGYKSIYGDMMEAFIGAVYLDKGYRFCKRFIENKLLLPHYDLEEIINSTTNYKSVLIEWSQKENKEVCFEIIDVKQNRKAKEFIAQVTIDSVPIAQGAGLNKKKAEQNAAYKTCKALDLE